MEGSSAPPEIVALAEERAAARAERDWSTADALKARIEAAGWGVVDEGAAYALSPSRRPDMVEHGRTIYGALESVPSRLDEPAAGAASVVVVGGPDPALPDAALHALSQHLPAATQVVVVVDRSIALDGPADEVVTTVEPFAPADALQAAIRRATGSIIIVLDPERVPGGDIVGPLVEALADPSVAVAGIEGLLSADLRHYAPVAVGDVTTLRSGCYAFRRQDAISRGPIDGRLHLRGSVAAWWGLLLRDQGADTEPRRALALDLPLADSVDEAELPADHARLARRDNYRIADRFAGHRWLASREPAAGRFVGDGAEQDRDHDDPHEAGHTGQP